MTVSSGHSSPIQAARRFVSALRHSIHDRKIEAAGGEIVFLFDTDVATNAIVGLTSWADPRRAPEIGGRSNLVHALLTTGFLPEMHFLRPHLAELHRKLSSLPDTDMLVKFHSGTMKHLAKYWGLPADERELKNRVNDAQGFYDYIRAEGYEIFVKLELCLGGHWKARLNRMYRYGRLRIEAPSAPEAEVMSNDPVAQNLAPRINKLRRAPQFTLNDQVDALALAELNRLSRAGRNVRFFSETESLRCLFAESSATDAVLCDASGVTLFRDEDYFIMRTSFPALAFAHERRPVQRAIAAPDFTLSDLEELLGNLNDLLLTPANVRDEKTFADVLSTESFRGRPLAALLDDFHKLQFLSTVFLTWEPPRELQDWLPSLYEATRPDGVAEKTQRIVGSSLNALWADMAHEIEHLTEWRSEFPAILDAADRRAGLFDGATPSLWLEIGLGRWGLDTTLAPTSRRRLSESVRELLDTNSPARNNICSDLALTVARRGVATDDDLAYRICLLWFLRQHSAVRALFERAAPAERDALPVGVHVLALISQVRTAGRRAADAGTSIEAELVTAVTEASNLVKACLASVDASDAAYAMMGLAHVTFLAWDTHRDANPVLGRAWARSSFDTARDAAPMFPARSLAWAFAIGHCAFVGARARLAEPEWQPYMDQLIRNIPVEYDHFRFRDAKAWEFTARVESALARNNGRLRKRLSDSPEARATLCAQLASANRVLKDVNAFGDEEVTRHRELITHYASRLQCSDLLRKTSGDQR